MNLSQANRSIVWLLALLTPCALQAADSALDATPDLSPGDLQPTTAVWHSPGVDVDRLLAEDEMNREDPRVPYRIGTALEAGLTPADSGTWQREDGRWVWRIVLHSPGAHWLLPVFDRVHLEPGAELWLYDPEWRTRRGPFTQAHVVDGRMGFAPIDGDTLVVEIDWPDNAPVANLDAHLSRVFHGYRSWSGVAAGACSDDAGACNFDVNCPLGDEWQDEKRGVVKIVIPDQAPSSNVAVCTGSLVNNTALDCTPYVLTADHCFTADSDMVNTSFIFNYERPGCGPGSASQAIFGTNALLRARHPATDFRLLEVGLSFPTEGLYFNGWSRFTVPPPEAYSIHHPKGAPMKISHTALQLVPGDGDPYPEGYWRVIRWAQGVVEPGSSGAPLFDPHGRVIGQLDSGSSACEGPQPNNQGDNFGRLDVSWDVHPTFPALRLKDWLDPSFSNVISLNGMDQAFCGAPASRLVFAGFDASGSCQPDCINPGGTDALRVQLLNDGPLPAVPSGGAETIPGTLSTQDPQVQILDGTANWPPIQNQFAEWSLFPHFSVAVDPERLCGKSLRFEVDADSESSAFRVSTGAVFAEVRPFDDDMEYGPGGWTVVPVASWAQTTSNSAPGGGVTSWYVPDSSATSDSHLIMPSYDSLSGPPELAAFDGLPPRLELRFEHYLNSECGVDGGVLEYSTDGSTWQDAGPWITEGGYNSVILPGSGGALAGRLGWSGDLGAWTTVQVDFSDLEGSADLHLRWRFATDNLTGGDGWYVDNVILEAPLFDCSPSGCVDHDFDGECLPPDGADCDDTNPDVNPSATEVCNALDDDCDDLVDEDELGEDTDGDHVHNLCDNCYDSFNPTQPDVDGDGEGDHCDLDDGLIYIDFQFKNRVRWQEEADFDTWNSYRGDLRVLTGGGDYTQPVGSNDLADRRCGLTSPYWQGIGLPDPGESAFFLSTGVNNDGESSLGSTSSGSPRENTHPCPVPLGAFSFSDLLDRAYW